jgi:hypothetical protein
MAMFVTAVPRSSCSAVRFRPRTVATTRAPARGTPTDRIAQAARGADEEDGPVC